jgi:hypothetical protein
MSKVEAEKSTVLQTLIEAAQGAGNELQGLLTAIKNHNGIDPGTIEGLITKGEAMVVKLHAAIAAAQKAGTPAPPVSEVAEEKHTESKSGTKRSHHKG